MSTAWFGTHQGVNKARPSSFNHALWSVAIKLCISTRGFGDGALLPTNWNGAVKCWGSTGAAAPPPEAQGWPIGCTVPGFGPVVVGGSDCLLLCQVKLVNIRNDDITDGNPKLTLGLIWTIILHFQVGNKPFLPCGAWAAPSTLLSVHARTFRGDAGAPSGRGVHVHGSAMETGAGE